MIGHKKTWFWGDFFFDKVGTLPAHHNCCPVPLALGSRQACLTCGFSELKHVAGWLHFVSIKVRAPKPAGDVRPPCTRGQTRPPFSSNELLDQEGTDPHWLLPPQLKIKLLSWLGGISARQQILISSSSVWHKTGIVATQGVIRALYQLQTLDLFWGAMPTSSVPLSSSVACFLLRSASYHIVRSTACTCMEPGFLLLYISCACLHQCRVDEECSSLSFSSILNSAVI